MQDVPKRLEKAEKLLRKGKTDLAAAEFQALLQQYSEADDLLDVIVDLLIAHEERSRAAEILGQRFERKARLRQVTEAQRLFERLQQIQKQPATRHLSLAAMYEGAKKPREAETAFRQAAGLFKGAGAVAQELAAWRQVLRLNPRDYSTCLEVAGRAEAGGDSELAGSACAMAAGLSNEDPKLLERAVRLLPARNDLRLRLARAFLASGGAQAAAAWTVLEPLRALAAQDPDVAAMVTEASLATEQPEEARHHIELALGGKAADDAKAAWAERGMRCLRLLARAASPAASSFAVLLENHCDPNDPSWRIALDGALADAHEQRLLEHLAGAFERTHQKPKMISALYQSFDLAVNDKDYSLAAEQVQRILVADPYEAAAPERLDLLRGHVNDERLVALLGLMRSESEPESAPEEEAEEATGATPTDGASLDDLLLQAEIFLQYQLLGQARERAKVLARLYPGAEVGNERLAHLYDATGLQVQAPPPQAPPAPPVAPAAAAAAAPVVRAAAGGEALDLGDVNPIVHALHREATPRRVFLAAVNQFGRLWQADRCLAAQFNAGQPPSNVVEYCAPGLATSDAAFVARLLTLVEAHIPATSPRWLLLPRANETPQIAQTLERMGLQTVVVQPLEQAGNILGVVLLEFRAPRAWSPRDTAALAGLADQMVLALTNARLRGLLRQFTELDEQTGLLRISSLLEVLVAECLRARDQKTAVSVMCLEFVHAAVNAADPEIRAWLERVAQKVTAYLRPNDAGASLRPTQLLFVLPDTLAINCSAVFHRVRLALADFVWPDGHPVVLAAGAAESAAESELAPEDVATDMLDRALRALALHRPAPEQPLRVVAASPLAPVAAASAPPAQ